MENGTMTNMPFSEPAELLDAADSNSAAGEHQPGDEAGMERPAIRDLQTAAEEFNAAFNTTLYELESSRKIAAERSSRINELDDSIKNINDALTNEINKSHRLEKVTAIMEIARKNNYITIAEGVENPTSLAILWELGVSLAQGYFIQAPAGSLDFDSQDVVPENRAEAGNKSTYSIG
jgi:hypothetical protein